MRILFHTPQIDVRGTCVAIYDYVHYNETLLKGSSAVLTARKANHDVDDIFKFTKRFKIIYYDHLNEIEDIASDFDIFYTIKYGKKDEIICKKLKQLYIVCLIYQSHMEMYMLLLVIL